MPKVNYEIVVDNPGSALVIRDVGPWDECMTVTNAVEEVVELLVEQGRLPEGRRLFYFDSENQYDEIVVKNGQFVEFRPGPPSISSE